jgi:hypothetical protein
MELWKAYRSPSPLEERCKQVDAHECDVPGTCHRLVLLRWRDAHEQTDVHHGETHGNRSPEEGLATSQRVGGEDQEQTTHQHLDDTVNSCGEKTDGSALQSEVREDLRGVVVAKRHISIDF